MFVLWNFCRDVNGDCTSGQVAGSPKTVGGASNCTGKQEQAVLPTARATD